MALVRNTTKRPLLLRTGAPLSSLPKMPLGVALIRLHVQVRRSSVYTSHTGRPSGRGCGREYGSQISKATWLPSALNVPFSAGPPRSTRRSLVRRSRR